MPPARRATSASRRSNSTSTSCQAHRISAAFRGMRGCGRCGKASPRSSRMRSATSRRRGCYPRASRWRTICGAPAACSPTRSTSCSARGRHRPSRCSLRCYQTQTLAMEDPGFWLHRMVLRHNGIEPVPVPVDDDGLDVAALAESGATTVLATPAHQSPTGVVLSAARRTALVQWARADHVVIEDDYDAEYRYDRAPIGALQGIAPDRVVYVGSTSKTLAPGLRIGWMVLPAHLVGPVTLSKGLARHRKFGDGSDRVREAVDVRRIRPASAPDAPPLSDAPKCVAASAGSVSAGGGRAAARIGLSHRVLILTGTRTSPSRKS